MLKSYYTEKILGLQGSEIKKIEETVQNIHTLKCAVKVKNIRIIFIRHKRNKSAPTVIQSEHFCI